MLEDIHRKWQILGTLLKVNFLIYIPMNKICCILELKDLLLMAKRNSSTLKRKESYDLIDDPVAKTVVLGH